MFRERDGAWSFDHDTFLLEPADHFFEATDERFSTSQVCLCTRRPLPGAGVTQPAYWLSPLRWPEGLSSFAPVPFQPNPYYMRPDPCRHDGDLRLPGKDTLGQVREELDAMNLAGTFPTEGDHPAPTSWLHSRSISISVACTFTRGRPSRTAACLPRSSTGDAIR